MPDSSFLDAQLTYESLGSFDLDNAIARLDGALANFNSSGYTESLGKDYVGFDISCRHNIPPAQLKRECDNDPNCKAYNVVPSWNGGCLKNSVGPLVPSANVNFYSKSERSANEVETAFAPIAEHYSKLVNINESLRKYISKTATNLAESDPRLINEERYSNRVHPEESIAAREVSNGLIPEIRQSTLPYIISVSVFMAALSIFLIFQMNGFSGQINLPPGVASLFAAPAPDARPFYQNPMILGGISIVLLSALVIFIVLYFQAKNTNSSRQ